jgi:hypothetical protein
MYARGTSLKSALPASRSRRPDSPIGSFDLNPALMLAGVVQRSLRKQGTL